MVSVKMSKRDSTTFSETKVARSSFITAKALERGLDLEKEVLRLWHQVQVLSKRNHKAVFCIGELLEESVRGEKEKVMGVVVAKSVD